MKESGINYFSYDMTLPTGGLKVLYTFEAGAGVNIPSISGGQSGYSGTLSSATNFWVKPGSGFSSGTTITINNASGLHSEEWTKIFVFEKVDVNPCILFDSLNNGSGHRIGITKANRPYFESYNEEPILAASLNNYSSKNAISVSYVTNSVTFGLYNFNGKVLESESYDYPFQATRSDAQTLGGSFTGYWDYYIHRTDFQSPTVIGQWLSGLFARPTGYVTDDITTCVTGVTGYQDVFVGVTGITGQVTTFGGDEGRDYYTGAFPTSHSTAYLTGYLSSGIATSGIAGLICTTLTGVPVAQLELLTGYSSSFGMQKIQSITYIEQSDIFKTSQSYTPFVDIYNRRGTRNFSGYFIPVVPPTGQTNLYLNGVAQANSGWYVTGSYIIISGAGVGDLAFYDLKSGDRRQFPVTAGVTGFAFSYSGQEIYLNGVNLVSGYDYVTTGNILSLTNRNTGIYGDIFEYPIVLTSRTGNGPLVTGVPFQRNTSNVYRNGVRQPIYRTYIEGATFDMLSGNSFDPDDVSNLYGNTNFYWE